MHMHIRTHTKIWNGPNFDYADAELGEDLVNDIEFASPGVGSAANSYMSLINVVDDQIRISRAGLSNNSPGQGAFTIYHNRSFTATHSIVPGSEIFVRYIKSLHSNCTSFLNGFTSTSTECSIIETIDLCI